MHLIRLLFFLIIIGPWLTGPSLFAQDTFKILSENKQWLELLRYRKRIFGGYKSEQDSKDFFLAAQGKFNPEVELKKFINELKEDPTSELICKFPARLIFVKKHLNEFKNFNSDHCIEYNKFKNKIRAKSVSIEFSSYYINRPASAFGHTLMRFSKTGEFNNSRSMDLLDYALNYSAIVTTENSLLYGVFGIFGLFKGKFTTLPYYYKVREYNDSESRDLWTYKLNMSQEQIDFLIAHTWEMGKAYFNYYYFDENCSYHLLGLLNAVNPDWNLIERSRSIIIPIDTVKTLMETPGLVTQVNMRKSSQKKFYESLSRLEPKDQKFVSNIIETPNLDISNHEYHKQVLILDAAMNYYDYKHAKEILKEENHITSLKTKLLIKRSKLKSVKKEKKKREYLDERPDLSHGARKLSFNFSHHKYDESTYQINYRGSLHRYLDWPIGSLPTSSIEMGNLSLKYLPNELKSRDRVIINQFIIAHVFNLNPLSRFEKNLSYKMNLGYKRSYDTSCSHCSNYFLEISPGISTKLKASLYPYLFFNIEPSYSPGYSKNHGKLHYGPELGINYLMSNNIRMSGSLRYNQIEFTNLNYQFSQLFELQFNFSKYSALNLSYKHSNFDYKWNSTFAVYF